MPDPEDSQDLEGPEYDHLRVTFPRNQMLFRYKDGYEPPEIFGSYEIEPMSDD